jgi:pyruvate-ferredoxin/flavodoxin oxidoreductase
MEHQQMAVDSGHWPLYRYNPENVKEGKNPLKLDSKAPKIKLEDFIYTETRYKMLQKIDPVRTKYLLGLAQAEVNKKWNHYEQLAAMDYSKSKQE